MNRLKELRKEKKLSQIEIAKILNISEKTVSRWENGESQIKADKAQTLADYFGVSAGYMLGYTDNSKQYDDEKVLEIDGNIIAFSEKKWRTERAEKTLTGFVHFLSDNNFFLTNEEIVDVIKGLYSLSTNHGDSLKSATFQEVFKNKNHKYYNKLKEDYSFIFGKDFERSDLEKEIHGYFTDETTTKEKAEKLLSVLKSTYGTRDYLD